MRDQSPGSPRGLIAHSEGNAHLTFSPSLLKSRTGARIYYLRHILHDYLDEKCLMILQNTAAIMDEKSLISIDEMILSSFKPYY